MRAMLLPAKKRSAWPEGGWPRGHLSRDAAAKSDQARQRATLHTYRGGPMRCQISPAAAHSSETAAGNFIKKRIVTSRSRQLLKCQNIFESRCSEHHEREEYALAPALRGVPRLAIAEHALARSAMLRSAHRLPGPYLARI